MAYTYTGRILFQYAHLERFAMTAENEDEVFQRITTAYVNDPKGLTGIIIDTSKEKVE